ncbi:hypothetical protein ACOZB4_34060 [Paenibacillus sp. NPDC058898]|uniref:hypothetical protein n=1 Tax=Paenibacillus sp. NPDC058898 TaxID=3346669 RepID=UPI003BF60CCA
MGGLGRRTTANHEINRARALGKAIARMGWRPVNAVAPSDLCAAIEPNASLRSLLGHLTRLAKKPANHVKRP